MQQLGEYSKFSGLKPNINKCKCIWLGPPKTPVDESLPIIWVNELKVLGIVFCAEPEQIEELNFPDKIKSMPALLDFWRIRNLSLIGRVTVIKALAISKLVHLFSSLPTPRSETMAKIKQMLFKFIWNGKNDKIRRTKICQSYENDGIKMVDVDLFVASLKCSWIKRLQSNSVADRKCVIGSRNSLNKRIENLSWHGTSMLKSLAKKTGNKFLADVLHAWARFVDSYKYTPESFTSEVIWCNDILKYKCSINKKWSSRGLFFCE